MSNFELDGGIKIYLREIGKTPLLTPAEEVVLAERIKKGDTAARAHMIQANLRLVVKIAQDYANYGLPLLDLISEGNIGLMKAVERFDPQKGGKLSTYAAWWIKQSIKRALANQSKTIRLPVHMVDKISKMRRVAMVLAEELGREPTDEELAEEIGIDRAKLAHLKSAALRPASLDAPISEDDTTEFGEIVGDENAQTPFELLSHKNMHLQLDGLLEVLDERELKIIEARFGLNGQKPRTLEEVGQEFGVTRERIRQLQNIALKKLRRALQKREDPAPKPLDKKRKRRRKKNADGEDIDDLDDEDYDDEDYEDFDDDEYDDDLGDEDADGPGSLADALAAGGDKGDNEEEKEDTDLPQDLADVVEAARRMGNAKATPKKTADKPAAKPSEQAETQAKAKPAEQAVPKAQTATKPAATAKPAKQAKDTKPKPAAKPAGAADPKNATKPKPKAVTKPKPAAKPKTAKETKSGTSAAKAKKTAKTGAAPKKPTAQKAAAKTKPKPKAKSHKS